MRYLPLFIGFWLLILLGQKVGAQKSTGAIQRKTAAVEKPSLFGRAVKGVKSLWHTTVNILDCSDEDGHELPNDSAQPDDISNPDNSSTPTAPVPESDPATSGTPNANLTTLPTEMPTSLPPTKATSTSPSSNSLTSQPATRTPSLNPTYSPSTSDPTLNVEPEQLVLLQNGAPLSGQKSASMLEYVFGPVSPGDSVGCSTTSNDGDADLYTKFGAKPSLYPNMQSNDCSSFGASSIESCQTGPAQTTSVLYIIVHSYAGMGFTDLTITCTIITSMPQPSTDFITHIPSQVPSKLPTLEPTRAPTRNPTLSPTDTPTHRPTSSPTKTPTRYPTNQPTLSPTDNQITALTSALPHTGQSSNTMLVYKLEPILKGERVACSTAAPNGDADLYVKFGEKPSLYPDSQGNDCSSFTANSDETCQTDAAQTITTAFVIVHAYAGMGFTDLTITCTVITSMPQSSKPSHVPTKLPTLEPTRAPTRNPTLSPTDTPTHRPTSSPTKTPTRYPTNQPTLSPTDNQIAALTSALPLTGQSSNTMLVYKLEPILKGERVACSTAAPNGDADLYVKFGEKPSLYPDSQGNDCSSFTANSDETCQTDAAQTTTTAFVIVHAYAGMGFNGLTIVCSTLSSTTPAPTKEPTGAPTEKPTKTPSESPTKAPTIEPTPDPTKSPTTAPVPDPTKSPTLSPTPDPTKSTSPSPTPSPTLLPTKLPTGPPTESPTSDPTFGPTNVQVPQSTTPAPTQTPPDSVRTSSFNLDLDLVGVEDDNEFRNAVAKWGKIITGDLPDHNRALSGGTDCGPWPSFIDDVYICGTYGSIDGRGKILGSAGPRHYRPSLGLPITGTMKFDIDDVAGGTIRNLMGVILHEMGHVLGIGSLWVINGLTSSYQVPCPYSSSTLASREYQRLSGCSNAAVPVEDGTGRAGSDCGHWKESCFGTEVMTSAANSVLPFSRITIAGLEDLGYEVDYSEADSFTWDDMNPECRCNNVRRRLSNSTSSFDIHGQPVQRRLSNEGRESAMNYGKQLLEEVGQSMPLIPDPDVLDIGNQVVFVLYLENEIVHSIMVTAMD